MSNDALEGKIEHKEIYKNLYENSIPGIFISIDQAIDIGEQNAQV